MIVLHYNTHAGTACQTRYTGTQLHYNQVIEHHVSTCNFHWHKSTSEAAWACDQHLAGSRLAHGTQQGGSGLYLEMRVGRRAVWVVGWPWPSAPSTPGHGLRLLLQSPRTVMDEAS